MKLTNAKDISRGPMTALLYGQPGMGKTTTIKFLPGKTLVFDVDRTTRVLAGCDNIDICYVDNVHTWDMWDALLHELRAQKAQNALNYDNYAIDNISELERCLLSDLGRKGRNNGIPSQADYQQMQFKLVNTLRYMKSLNGNVILTAWESIEPVTTYDGQIYSQIAPQINKRILNNICGLCDIVGRIKINSEGKRGYTFTATNGVYAKNQYDDRKGCLQEKLIPNPEDEEEPKEELIHAPA